MPVTYEQHDTVTVVNLGDTENRFNQQSVAAINTALDAVPATGPAALVTTGSGKFYSNGLDLDWLQSGKADTDAFGHDIQQLLLRVQQLDVITVAAINGHAYAAGAVLTAAHDFAFMREDRGYWCLPEVDIGVPFTPIAHDVVAGRIPRPGLNEAMLIGRRYTAPEALDARIITGTAPEDQLLNTAIEFAADASRKDRRVIREHKALLVPRSSQNAHG